MTASPDQTAMKAVSMAFALARQLPADSSLPEPAGNELWDQPTDILGFDAVGQALARALEPLVSLKEICYYDPEHDPTLRSNHAPHDAHFHYWPFFDMLEKSEFMFINLPATPANLVLFDDLSCFNHDMKVIIISNGFEEVTNRLVEKCARGELGGVAFESDDPEILNRKYSSNIFVTPHNAHCTKEALANLFKIWTDTMLSAADHNIINRVN